MIRIHSQCDHIPRIQSGRQVSHILHSQLFSNPTEMAGTVSAPLDNSQTCQHRNLKLRVNAGLQREKEAVEPSQGGFLEDSRSVPESWVPVDHHVDALGRTDGFDAHPRLKAGQSFRLITDYSVKGAHPLTVGDRFMSCSKAKHIQTMSCVRTIPGPED